MDTDPDVQLRELFGLKGSVSVVTGAGHGFGAAMASALGRAGSAVALIDVDARRVRTVEAELRSSGAEVKGWTVDVTQVHEIAQAAADIEATLGPVAILVNNAGIGAGNDTPSLELPLETWKQVMEVNLTGYFIVAQTFGRGMVARGYGRVVQIASAAISRIPRLTQRYPVVYPVSKAGVEMLTRSLALQWAPCGVTVNSISPGFADTGFVQRDEVRMRQMRSGSPFNRLCEPADLMTALFFLTAPGSSFITGIDVRVDGGYAL